MPEFRSFADRLWFAYQCLPRENGSLPRPRDLERDNQLPRSIIHKILIEERQEPRLGTLSKLAQAFAVDERWLTRGEGDGPVPPPGIVVPPRPGKKWTRYGEIPGWGSAVELAKLLPQFCPPEAYELAAMVAVTRPTERLTAELVRAVASWAWETSTPAEQVKHSTAHGKAASVGATKARALKMNDSRKRR